VPGDKRKIADAISERGRRRSEEKPKREEKQEKGKSKWQLMDSKLR
jgi:hypothetical protein